jgi:hypothetical protein
VCTGPRLLRDFAADALRNTVRRPLTGFALSSPPCTSPRIFLGGALRTTTATTRPRRFGTPWPTRHMRPAWERGRGTKQPKKDPARMQTAWPPTGPQGHEANSCYRCMHHQRSSPASRRSHTHSSSFGDSNRSHPYSSYAASSTSTYTASERRPVKQAKRLSPKATLVKSASHLMDIEPERPAILSRPDAHQHPVTDLRPCHACKSAPRRKKDLENYLDCRRCDGRTCYICARQCFGACGKAVCKKCIVEVGDDGDPWCLDCYSRNINS